MARLRNMGNRLFPTKTYEWDNTCFHKVKTTLTHCKGQQFEGQHDEHGNRKGIHHLHVSNIFQQAIILNPYETNTANYWSVDQRWCLNGNQVRVQNVSHIYLRNKSVTYLIDSGWVWESVSRPRGDQGARGIWRGKGPIYVYKYIWQYITTIWNYNRW